MTNLKLIHPGEVLREEFLKPMALTAYRLARSIHVPVNRVTGIVNEERGISADTALRLARYFGTSAGFWINLQKQYELRLAQRQAGARIKREIEPLAETG